VANDAPFMLVLDQVVDDALGDLSPICNPALPATLLPGSMVNCSTTANLSGAPGDVHRNVATATAHDLHGNLLSAQGEASVRILAQDPDRITLTPAHARLPVETEHCLIAQATTSSGVPVSGTPIEFSVTGASRADGTEISGTDGSAEFCYETGLFPGTDTVVATLLAGSEPTASALLEVTAPESSVHCKLFYRGFITPELGPKVSVAGFALAAGHGVIGIQSYRPLKSGQQGLAFKSPESLTCASRSASLFGHLHLPDRGLVEYRIDLSQVHRKRAEYQLRLSTGFDSGPRLLRSGFLDIHGRSH